MVVEGLAEGALVVSHLTLLSLEDLLAAAFWEDAASTYGTSSVEGLAAASQASVLMVQHQVELSKADYDYRFLQRLKPVQSVQRLKPLHSKASDA